MSKLIPIVLLLSILLAACAEDGERGEGPLTVESQPAQTGQEEPAAPAEFPATEAPPTEVPPTEASPTEVPPTEEPPVEMEAEAPPADESSSGSEGGWGESGTTAQSACDHPYFPLRTGTTWTMSSGEGEPLTWGVVSVDGDLELATAEMKMSSGGLELFYTWECSSDGGLVSYGFGNQGISALGPEVNIEVSDGSGMFLPAPELLEPGYSWDTQYRTTYSMSQLDGDQEIEISGEMDTMQTSHVLANDPITFQGETVPGLLIQQDTEINMVMSMMGESMENVMATGGEMELGRGLGMLRQTSFTEFGDFTMDVTDIYVP
jgi:hypothetical protein